MGCGSSKDGKIQVIEPSSSTQNANKDQKIEKTNAITKEQSKPTIAPPTSTSPKKLSPVKDATKVEVIPTEQQTITAPTANVSSASTVKTVEIIEPQTLKEDIVSLPSTVVTPAPEIHSETKPLVVENPPGKATIRPLRDPSKLLITKPSFGNISELPKLPDKITDQKLPEIKPRGGVLIEIDLGKQPDRPTTSSVKTRLEQTSRLSGPTIQTLQRKQALAAERRMQQQGMRLRKAREDVAVVEERRPKVKDFEEKKAEQLKRIMVEKRKQAEQNRLQLEAKKKKDLEEEAKHAQEVKQKALQRKQEEDNKENAPSEPINGMGPVQKTTSMI